MLGGCRTAQRTENGSCPGRRGFGPYRGLAGISNLLISLGTPASITARAPNLNLGILQYRVLGIRTTYVSLGQCRQQQQVQQG